MPFSFITLMVITLRNMKFLQCYAFEQRKIFCKRSIITVMETAVLVVGVPNCIKLTDVGGIHL